MKKHVVALTIIITVVSAGLALFFQKVSFTPLVASKQAELIDQTWKLLFSIASVVVTLVIVLLVYSVIFFRRRPDDIDDAAPIRGHAGLEILWTLAPLALVIFLGFYGNSVLQNVLAAPNPEKELEVRVTAFQWGWSFDYPELGIAEARQLVLPVDRQVLFILTAKDVIHSFYVPEFRMKEDTVPGMVTQLRITPTVVGEYRLECAELCGLAHAFMVAPVKVVADGEFQRWVEGQVSESPGRA